MAATGSHGCQSMERIISYPSQKHKDFVIDVDQVIYQHRTIVCAWTREVSSIRPICGATLAASRRLGHRQLGAESRHLHAAPTNGVVRHKPIGSGSLWERNEFGLVAGHLREAAFLPVLLGLLDPVL